MDSVGLPARIGYALAALAAAAVAAFYASMWLLPKFTSETADDDGAGLFRAALGIALGLGFTAALVGLTLPWKRRRRRGGRGRRLAISAVVVIIASVTFAAQEHHLVYDLLFATWLAYALAYTYVRYGLLDKPRTRSSGGSVAAASVE